MLLFCVQDVRDFLPWRKWTFLCRNKNECKLPIYLWDAVVPVTFTLSARERRTENNLLTISAQIFVYV